MESHIIAGIEWTKRIEKASQPSQTFGQPKRCPFQKQLQIIVNPCWTQPLHSRIRCINSLSTKKAKLMNYTTQNLPNTNIHPKENTMKICEGKTTFGNKMNGMTLV
jgi:hypothetical protein